MFGQSRFLKPEKMLIVAALKANADKVLRVFSTYFLLKNGKPLVTFLKCSVL
jgi:hypothetical protein